MTAADLAFCLLAGAAGCLMAWALAELGDWLERHFPWKGE